MHKNATPSKRGKPYWFSWHLLWKITKLQQVLQQHLVLWRRCTWEDKTMRWLQKVSGPNTVQDILDALTLTQTRGMDKYFQCAWDKSVWWSADFDETANGIHRAVLNCLLKHGLVTGPITAHSADNARVNSVYQWLRSGNSCTRKRVAQNTCKYGFSRRVSCFKDLHLVMSGLRTAWTSLQQQDITIERGPWFLFDHLFWGLKTELRCLSK